MVQSSEIEGSSGTLIQAQNEMQMEVTENESEAEPKTIDSSPKLQQSP